MRTSVYVCVNNAKSGKERSQVNINVNGTSTLRANIRNGLCIVQTARDNTRDVIM